MIKRLDPPLPMWSAKTGPGLAHLVIDYGAEAHLIWVIFSDKDGACYVVPNPEIRMQWNWSLGRRQSASRENWLTAPTLPTGAFIIARGGHDPEASLYDND